MDNSSIDEVSIRFSPPSDQCDCHPNAFDQLLQLNIEPNLNSSQCEQPNLEYLIIVDQTQVERVLGILKQQYCSFEMLDNAEASDEPLVPWFPQSLVELDECSKNIFTLGVELNADHPGFSDAIYRARRYNSGTITRFVHLISEPFFTCVCV